jgi:hypothetical protein
MVVQPRKFWDALEVKNGAFFPTTFDVIIDEAGTRAFIDYSMGWRGGSIDAELKDGKWILKSRGSWIT